VDVLDPMLATYSSDASGVINVTVPPQKAMVLVPQDQVIMGI
jgi:hypothetical protein